MVGGAGVGLASRCRRLDGKAWKVGRVSSRQKYWRMVDWGCGSASGHSAAGAQPFLCRFLSFHVWWTGRQDIELPRPDSMVAHGLLRMALDGDRGWGDL